MEIVEWLKKIQTIATIVPYFTQLHLKLYYFKM